MSCVFLPGAQDEFHEALLNYEQEQENLGSRFDHDVEAVVRRILANSKLWRVRPGGYRRVNCAVFPYFVAYHIRGETIVIVAVSHVRRKPGYWKYRVR